MSTVKDFLAVLPEKEEDFVEPLIYNYLERCKHPNYENPDAERLMCEFLRYSNLYRKLVCLKNEQR